MSKSRRYTWITIALAAVLIVAVLCAVLLTDGVAPPDRGASVSPSATTTKTTAGTVDSQYLKTAVESIYNPASAQERILANGSPAVYYISRHTNRSSYISLINSTGTINVGNKPALREDQQEPEAATGFQWWWFEVGNTTYFVPIQRVTTLQSFLTNYNLYSDSNVYAILMEDVTYNPNSVYTGNTFDSVNTMPYNFNATLDGAGHTIAANADFATGDRADKPITSGYTGDSNVCAGNDTQYNAHSMFIANLGTGTLKNFTLTDTSNSQGTRTVHNVAARQKHSGAFAMAYGGLVGVAGVRNSYTSTARSYITNVHVLLNGSHKFTDVADNLKQTGSIVMGGAVGYNRNCNIEQLTVTLNNQMQSFGYRGTKGFLDSSPGGTIYQAMAVVVGAQNVDNAVFKKVIAAGSGNIFANWNQNPSGAGNWTEIAASLGIIFGQVVKATTVEGVILDFPYGNVYARKSNNAYNQLYVGIFQGRRSRFSKDNEGIVDITFKDVYMTENIFTNISGLPDDKFSAICNDLSYTVSHPLKGAIGDEGSNKDQSGIGDISEGLWFDGNDGTVLRFTVCDSTVANIGFSQDSNYMIEVDGAGNGIVWDATWTNASGVQYNTAASGNVVYDPVFAQNSNTGVKLKAYGTYGGDRTTRNLKLSISKGDTATYTFNGTTASSVYDGNAIGYPQLRIDRVGNTYYNQDFMDMFDDALLKINLSNNNLTNPNLVNSDGVSIFNNSGYVWNKTMSDKREGIDGNWGYLAGLFTSVQKYVASSGEYVNVDSSSSATAETSRKLAKDAGIYKFNTSSICRAIALELRKSDGTLYYMLFTPGGDASFTHTVSPKPLDITVDTPNISYNGSRANFVSSAESPSARARYTLTGKIGNDDVSVDPTKVGYANSVGTPVNQAVNAGDYYLNVTGVIGNAASNYTLNASKNFSIKPVNVSITPPSLTLTYGNTVRAQSAFAGYTSEFTDFEGRPSEITALPSGTSLLFDVRIYGNDYLFGLSGNNKYSGKLNSGAYPIYLMGVTFSDSEQRGNYNITNDLSSPATSGAPSGLLTVNKARLNLSPIGVYSGLTYGDAYSHPTYKIEGLVYDETVETGSLVWVYDADASKVGYLTLPRAAGTHTVSLASFSIDGYEVNSDSSNYTYVNTQTAEYSIAAKTINLKVDYDSSVTYRYNANPYVFTGVIDGRDLAYSDDTAEIEIDGYADVNRTIPVDILGARRYYVSAVFKGGYMSEKTDGTTVRVSTDGSYIINSLLDTSGNVFDKIDILKAAVSFRNLDENQSVVFNAQLQSFAFTKDNIDALTDADAEKLYGMIKVEYNGSALRGVREGGKYTVTLSKEETGNYEALYKTGMTFEILKEDMTVTINGNETFEKFYNQNLIPNVVISVVGNTSGVDVSVTQGALLSISFKDASGKVVPNAKNVGTYTMTVSYPGTVNRNPASASISIVVKPKPLTFSLADSDGNDITASHAETRVYDKAVYAPDYVLDGVVSGESVDLQFVYKDEAGNVMSSAPINANSYVNDVYGSYSVDISLPSSYTNYTFDGYAYSLTIQKYMLEVDYLTRTSYALRFSGKFDHNDYLGWMTEAIRMYDADGTLFDKDALNMIRQASTDENGAYDGFIFKIFTDNQHGTPITDIVNQFAEYNGSLHMHILLNQAVLALDMFAGGNYGVTEDIDYTGHTTGIDISIVKFAVGVTVDNALVSGSAYRMFGTEYGLALRIYAVVGVDGQTFGASVNPNTGRVTHELTSYTARDIISDMSVTITNVGSGVVSYESGTQAPGSEFFAAFFKKNDAGIDGIAAAVKPLHAGTYEVSYKITIDSYPDDSTEFSTWTLQTSARIVIMPVQITVGGGLSDISIAYHHTVTEELLTSANENSVEHEGLDIVYSSDILGTKPGVGEYSYSASLAVAPGYEDSVYLSDYVLDETVGTINVEILEVKVSLKDLAFTYGDDYKILMTYDLLELEYLNCPDGCDSEEHKVLVEWFVSIDLDKDYGDAPSAGYHEGMLVPSYTNPGTNIHFTTKSLGNVTVNKKDVNITWNKLSGVYGNSGIVSAEYTLDTSLVAGDTLASMSNGTVYYNGLTYTGEGIGALNVGDYKYDFASIVFENSEGEDVSSNYNIASQIKGDYTITALTLNGKYVAKKAMEYTGDVITGLYVYEVDENIEIPNGETLVWEIKYYLSSDDVFADNNSVDVSNVGNYFGMARLTSVTGGNASVSNYDVSEIGWQQFAIDKATLSLESVDGYDETFAKTDVYDGTGANKLFTLADAVLTFNDGTVYSASKHGAITFAVTAVWTEDISDVLSEVTEAGVYKVTLSISNADNFKNMQFGDITLTVNKMTIDRDDLYNYISISFNAGGYTYNALAQKPTVSKIDTAEATLSVKYYMLRENQQPEEVEEPVNAGMYAIMIDYSARNYCYNDFAYLQNQVDQINTYVIAKSSNIDLMISTGVQYYNGQTQRPDSMIVRMLPGTDQVEYKNINDPSINAEIIFYEKTDKGQLKTEIINGVSYQMSSEGVRGSINKPGEYYVYVILNDAGVNFETPVTGWYIDGNVAGVYKVLKGIMSLSATSGETKMYDGTLGIDHDVLYEEGGQWYVNDRLIKFSGAFDYKFGDLTVDVSIMTKIGEEGPEYQKLYRWTWRYSDRYDAQGRPLASPVAPQKTYYSNGKDADGQATGPYNGIFDFAFVGTYKIDVKVDNDGNSFYEQAKDAVLEEGSDQIVQKDVPHVASGKAEITAATASFSLSSEARHAYYNDGSILLDSDPDAVFHGIGVSSDAGYKGQTIDNVNYPGLSEKDGFEVIDKSQLTFTYYTDASFTNVIARYNIRNAGVYYVRVNYSADNNKYVDSVFTFEFVVSPAQYMLEIVNSGSADEVYETDFGVEFDLSKAKITHKITSLGMGKNTQFENNIGNWIETVGTGESTYEGYKSDAGTYTIYYGWQWASNVSSDVRNNIMLFDVSSRDNKTSIRVNPVQLVDGQNSKVEVTGSTSGAYSVAMTSVSWEQLIKQGISMSMNYYTASGSVISGEEYDLNNYSFDYEWSLTGAEGTYMSVSGISAVGKYRLAVTIADSNIAGCNFVIPFEVTKAEAYFKLDYEDSKVYDGKGWTLPYAIFTLNGEVEIDITDLFETQSITVVYEKHVGESRIPVEGGITDAGVYTVRISGAETNDYADIKETLGTFTVEKADVEISYVSDYINQRPYSGQYKIDAGEIAALMLNGERYIAAKESRFVTYLSSSNWDENSGAEVTAAVNAYAAYVKEGGQAYFPDWIKVTYPGVSTHSDSEGIGDVGIYYPVAIYVGDDNVNYSIAAASGTQVPYIEIYKRTLEVEFISDSVMNVTYGDARPGIDEVKDSIEGNWKFADGSTVGEDMPVIHFTVEQLDNIYTQGSTVGAYSREYVIRGTLDSAWSNYQLSEIYEVVDINVAQRKVLVDANAFTAYIESELDAEKSSVVNGIVTFIRSYSGNAYSGIVLEYAGEKSISDSGVLTLDSALFNSIMMPIPVATNSITSVGSTSAVFNVQLSDTVNYVMDEANTVTVITATLAVEPAKVEVRLKDDVDASVYDEAARRVTMEYSRVEFLFENYFCLYDTDNGVIVEKGNRNSVWGVNYGGGIPANPATYDGITVVMNSANYVVTADGQPEDFVMSLVITKNTSDVRYSSWFDGVLIGGNKVYSKNYDGRAVRAADFEFAVQYGEYGNAPKSDLVVEIKDAATGIPVSKIKDVGRYIVRFSIAPTSNYCLNLDESKNFVEYRYNVTRYNLTNVDTVKAVDKNLGYDGALTLDKAVYNGTAQTPNIDIWASADRKLVLGVDYTIAPVGDNVNAGTFKMAVTLMGNYEGLVEVDGFRIRPVDMASAYSGGNIAVDYVKSYPYDGGKPVELQGLSITFNGTALVLDRDYTVAYEDGVDGAAPSQTGNHSAVVSGIGNFAGRLMDGDRDVVNYYIGASVSLPADIGSIIYGNNASAVFNLNVSSLAPEARLDGDLTVNILKITAYSGNTAVATLVSDVNRFIWIVGQGREPRAMKFLSTAGLDVGSYKIVVEYNATLAGADTVTGITQTNLTVAPSSDFDFRLTVNSVTSNTVKINLTSGMYRHYEYSLDGIEWAELPSDGIIGGLTDMKEYNIRVRINDDNFTSESTSETNWVSVSAKTTLAPEKVTDVARRLKSGFKASSIKDYLKMLDNDKLVATAEKTSDYTSAISDATNAFNSYLTKVNNAIASANSTANKMASKSSTGESGAAAAGTAASVGALSLALAGIMLVRRKKNDGGNNSEEKVNMFDKKAKVSKVAMSVLVVAICVVTVFAVCLTGCKEVYDKQNIFLAADNVILNGAQADISYTISEGNTVVYSYSKGQVEIGEGLESYIQAVMPSFDGATGFSFNSDYFDDISAPTFSGSEGTYEGNITDTRSFWRGDSNAGNYKKATVKLVADCKTLQLKLMEVKYTFAGFDIVLTAEYSW